MQKLIDGFQRFRREHYLPNQLFFEQIAARQQKPIALFITCSDSRVNPNLITQAEPGDLFLVRNAGNIVPPHGAPGGEAATIEYSIEVLGIRDIIICGHSQCGAIQALIAADALSRLPAVSAWCHHAEATRRIVRHKYRDLTLPELTAIAAQENVLVQINHLSTHPCVAARLAGGELRVFGWYYDIAAGQVLQYENSTGCFERLNGKQRSAPAPPVLAYAAAGE